MLAEFQNALRNTHNTDMEVSYDKRSNTFLLVSFNKRFDIFPHRIIV